MKARVISFLALVTFVAVVIAHLGRLAGVWHG